MSDTLNPGNLVKVSNFTRETNLTQNRRRGSSAKLRNWQKVLLQAISNSIVPEADLPSRIAAANTYAFLARGTELRGILRNQLFGEVRQIIQDIEANPLLADERVLIPLRNIFNVRPEAERKRFLETVADWVAKIRILSTPLHLGAVVAVGRMLRESLLPAEDIPALISAINKEQVYFQNHTGEDFLPVAVELEACLRVLVTRLAGSSAVPGNVLPAYQIPSDQQDGQHID